MATLQNLGVLKYRDKDGNWKPLPVVVQDADGGVSTISGKGAPTSATKGAVNQLYRDESTDKLYICTGVEGVYTWAAVVSDTEDAVTYTAQTLTDEQKTQARANIGAGTSNFSGLYNDLPDKPNIPAATVIDTTLSKSGQAADAKAAGDAIEKKLDATALPTAVNDALAQAKASGEFNGAKGEKGDPGPAGLKGADGKDGAGMDVTGAKVGQIAKITAVDSVGKPTAWEPVDMPSGGTYTLPIASPNVLGGVKPIAKTDAMTQGVGVDEAGALWTAALCGNEIWEEVYNVTFEEETTTFDADLGANYKKIIIAINVDFTATITQNRTIKFVFNQYNKNVFGNNLMGNQYKQMAYCIEVYDAFILSRRMKSDLSTTQNAQPFSDSAGIKQIINRAAIIRDDDPGINHINMSTLSSLAFQTGEVIKVYGVLA